MIDRQLAQFRESHFLKKMIVFRNKQQNITDNQFRLKFTYTKKIKPFTIQTKYCRKYMNLSKLNICLSCSTIKLIYVNLKNFILENAFKPHATCFPQKLGFMQKKFEIMVDKFKVCFKKRHTNV